MFPGRVHATCATAAFVLAVTITGATRADEPPSSDALAAAKSAYDRGAAEYDKGNYRAAAADLARADHLVPNDVTLEMALRAAIKSDEAVTAMELADRAEARGASSASLSAVVESARMTMGERAGRLTVQCHPSAPCTVRADDAPLTPGTAAWVKVGDHQVVVLTEGDKQSYRVHVDPRGSVVVRAAPPAPAAAPPPAPPADEGYHRPLAPVWFWAGASVTALFGLGTAVSGIDTSAKHDAFARDPNADTASAGRSAQLRTNVLLACGIVAAVATGVVGLFLVDWRGSSSARAKTAAWRLR